MVRKDNETSPNVIFMKLIMKNFTQVNGASQRSIIGLFRYKSRDMLAKIRENPDDPEFRHLRMNQFQEVNLTYIVDLFKKSGYQVDFCMQNNISGTPGDPYYFHEQIISLIVIDEN